MREPNPNIGAGVWRKAPGEDPDSNTALDTFQSAISVVACMCEPGEVRGLRISLLLSTIGMAECEWMQIEEGGGVHNRVPMAFARASIRDKSSAKPDSSWMANSHLCALSWTNSFRPCMACIQKLKPGCTWPLPVELHSSVDLFG